MITFRDPFDQYGELPLVTGAFPTILQANGYISRRVDSAAGVAAGAAYGRFPGSNGLDCHWNNGHALWFQFPSYANQVTQFKGIAMYFSAAPTDGFIMWSFCDSATTQIDFRYRAGGVVQITRNGTVVATAAAGSIAVGRWYWVEMKVTVDSTTGFAEWKQDGVSIINFTGNTKASTNAYSNNITIGSSSAPALILDIWLDDAVQYNPTGAAPTTYTGDKSDFTPNWASWASGTVMAVGQQYKDGNNNIQRVTAVTGDAKTGSSPPTWSTTGGLPTTDNHVTTVVVGTGANPGAANWMAVAEVPPDGDSSYNASSTVGDTDRFVGPALPSSLTGIVEVAVSLYQRKDDAGTRSTRVSINSAGTVADSGTDLVQSSNYVYAWGSFTTDPNTGVAWTVGGVNGLTGWGYKVTA